MKIFPKSITNYMLRPLRRMFRKELDKRLDHFLASDILRNRRFLERLQARMESLQLEESMFGQAPKCRKRFELLALASEVAKKNIPDGLWLEFGVYKGKTISFIATLTSRQIYGFDSFEGLPDDWVQGRYRTAQKGKRDLGSVLPTVPQNVELIKGWFKDTLPEFVEKHPGPVALLHVDSDLYSSAKCIFDNIPIQDGTVIVFDEYYNYPAWREGEYKAFQEFLHERNMRADCIGYCDNSNQAAFVVRFHKSAVAAPR